MRNSQSKDFRTYEVDCVKSGCQSAHELPELEAAISSGCGRSWFVEASTVTFPALVDREHPMSCIIRLVLSAIDSLSESMIFRFHGDP